MDTWIFLSQIGYARC